MFQKINKKIVIAIVITIFVSITAFLMFRTNFGEEPKKEIIPTQTEEVSTKHIIDGLVEVTNGPNSYNLNGYDELKDNEKGERFCSYEIGKSFVIKNISDTALKLDKSNFVIFGNDLKFDLVDSANNPEDINQDFLSQVIVDGETIVIEQNKTKTINLIGQLEIIGTGVNSNASEEENGYKLSYKIIIDGEEFPLTTAKPVWINCNKRLNVTKE